MSSEQSDKFGETIQPIARPRRTVTESSAQPIPAAGAKLRNAVIAGVLIAGLAAVFFVLPGDPDEASSSAADDNAAIEVSVVADAAPTLTEEERRRLDALAQRDLAALLTQQDRLRARGAEQWGGADWERYTQLALAGDDAYLADDLALSAQSYAEALTLGRELLEESGRLLESSIDAGYAALEAADWRAARQHFAAALAIEPENERALAGDGRARSLPDVLEKMDEGRRADDAGELPVAIEHYRAALRIDSEWSPARTALNDAIGRLEQYEFDRKLDAGYGALSESRFEEALESFDAALAMRPDSAAARDGRFQAEEGLRLGQIALARVRALAFERRELWSEAIDQYEAALQTDPTLEYAIAGLERARARRDLEVKVLNLLDNPRLLFDDSVLADAFALREQVANVEPRGERTDDQLARLDRLLEAATREYPVELVSDGMTNVTLFRVGAVGTFMSTQVSLRPGNYTAVGSRIGYRDVRRSFTVLPGEVLDPIEVVCVEPI